MAENQDTLPGMEELAGTPEEPKEEPAQETQEPKAQPDAELQETLKRQQQAIDQQNQRFEQLQQYLQSQPRGQQGAPQVDPDQVKQRFYEDPISFLQASNQQAQQQAIRQVQMINYDRDKNLARKEARDADPDLFDKYRDEIEQTVNQKYHPQYHTNPEVWRVALNEAKGLHAEEVAKYLSDKKAKAQNQGPAAPSLRGQPSGRPANELSDEEKHVAENVYFMSSDDYKKSRDAWDKQKQKLHRSALRDALQSPWADYMTFDSRLQKKKQRAS